MLIHCGEVGVAGFYSFELNGVPVFEVPSKNLITDFGWDRLSNLTRAATSGSTIQVGTSNVPPTTADTALGGLLASKTATSNVVTGTGTDATGNYSFTRSVFTYAQGAVVGNVSEVGYKVASGDASLTSRSLVKDGSGNPAIIVVTSIDQLTVNYELRYYRASLDTSGTVTVAGVSTNYIMRTGLPAAGTSTDTSFIGGMSVTACGVTHYGTGSTLGAADTNVSGSGVFVGTLAVASTLTTVGPTSTTVVFTTGTIDVTSGNTAGGVLNAKFSILGGGSVLGAYGDIKMNFSPAIPKTSTKTLSYSLSFTFTRL